MINLKIWLLFSVLLLCILYFICLAYCCFLALLYIARIIYQHKIGFGIPCYFFLLVSTRSILSDHQEEAKGSISGTLCISIIDRLTARSTWSAMTTSSPTENKVTFAVCRKLQPLSLSLSVGRNLSSEPSKPDLPAGQDNLQNTITL
jgi:MFS family permease